MILELSDITNSKEVKELKRAMESYNKSCGKDRMESRCAGDSLHGARMNLANKFEQWIYEGLI